MDLLMALILLAAFIIVPGLINYYANRWSAVGERPARWDMALASFALSWALLTVVAMIILAIALVWDGLRSELSDFINKGFRGYAFDRPYALSGVFTLISLVTMAVMGVLGWFRVPGRYVK